MKCKKVKISKILAANIKRLRECSGMSKSELALAIGVSKQAIWNLENEVSWITLDKIEKLAFVFGIEEDELFKKHTK